MIIGRRRSRVVGAIWALVGVALVAAGILLWLDERVVSFELPAAIVALVLAWSWWRQHATLDRHGIATVGGFSERRVLWASVDRVEVRRRAWFRPAIVLHLKGSGTTVPVPASAGLRRRQRNRLLEFMTDVARQHGFDVVAASGEPLAGPGAAMDEVRERVLATAGSGPTFASTESSPATTVSSAVSAEADGDAPRRPTPLDAGPGRPTATTPAPVVDRRARMPSWLRDEPDDGVVDEARASAGDEARASAGDEAGASAGDTDDTGADEVAASEQAADRASDDVSGEDGDDLAAPDEVAPDHADVTVGEPADATASTDHGRPPAPATATDLPAAAEVEPVAGGATDVGPAREASGQPSVTEGN